MRKNHWKQVVGWNKKTEEFGNLECALLDCGLVVQDKFVDHLAQNTLRMILNVLLDTEHYVV